MEWMPASIASIETHCLCRNACCREPFAKLAVPHSI